MQAQRLTWQEQRGDWDRKHLVFLDETAVRTNLVRRYGRSRKGERLVDSAPHGHWKTTTFIAALRSDGLTAPMALDGAMNSTTFLADVKQVLVPTLRAGDVVVMDNLRAHKQVAVQEALAKVGASVLYLPPYSPDLNPIELAFAKLKWLLRSAAERTVEGLWSLLGKLLDAFPPDECLRYLLHCGYHFTPP